MFDIFQLLQAITESVSKNLSQPQQTASYTIRKGSIYHIVETNAGIDILWHANNAVKVLIQSQYKFAVSC